MLLRTLAVEHFEDSGYEVLEAKDGHEAIAILKDRPDIQAIFTDVQMPGDPDGFGVAREAREAIPNCAVIVVSARQWPQSGDLQPGMRFITKPYSGSSVVEMFNQMLSED